MPWGHKNVNKVTSARGGHPACGGANELRARDASGLEQERMADLTPPSPSPPFLNCSTTGCVCEDVVCIHMAVIVWPTPTLIAQLAKTDGEKGDVTFELSVLCQGSTWRRP